MRRVYRVLEKFVDKIFTKKVLAKVIKTTLIITGLIVFFYGFNIVVDYLILGLLFCLLYVLTFHLNEFLKEEEEYLKKIFSK